MQKEGNLFATKRANCYGKKGNNNARKKKKDMAKQLWMDASSSVAASRIGKNNGRGQEPRYPASTIDRSLMT